MTINQNVTRTPQTDQHYEYRFKLLRLAILALKDETGAEFQLDKQGRQIVEPMDYARYFIEREGAWSASTARLYRAVLRYKLEKARNDAEKMLAKTTDAAYLKYLTRAVAQLDEALRVINRANETSEEREIREAQFKNQRAKQKKEAPRTSQLKAKKITTEQISELVMALSELKSQWGMATANWFFAGTVCGLRPREWKGAFIEIRDGRNVLVVKNAKATNGRSHSEYRRIDITDYDETTMATILVHLKLVKARVAMSVTDSDPDRAFEQMYENCRKVINRTARSLWPGAKVWPSLYTSRHRFAADAKAVFTKLEVAAMLGHADQSTAGRHYAEANTGRAGRLKVKPGVEDVAAVLARNKIKSSAPKPGK